MATKTVSAITDAASTEKNGPSKIAWPKRICATILDAINDPKIMPAP